MGTVLTPPQQHWVDALRYGPYRQAQQHMHNADHCFCCLGVACDISDIGAWRQTHLGVYAFHVPGGTYSAHLLPAKVAQRLQIKDQHGQFEYTAQLRSEIPARIRAWLNKHAITRNGRRYALLDALNDAGMPFPDIADLIEFAADQLFHRSPPSPDLS